MKYDDAKVEALLDAVAKWRDDAKSKGLEPGPCSSDVMGKADALRPPVEMEYVLPEWIDFVATHGFSSDGRVQYVAYMGFRFEQPMYHAIREATRRPKRDLVPAGSEWPHAEINELFQAYMSDMKPADGFRAVIDAIKAKCGV